METTDIDEHRARLVGLALGWRFLPEHNVYIPVGHDAGEQLPLALVQERIGPLLADAGKQKLAHNAKYDYIVCHRHGLPVRGVIIDTMIGEFLLDPGSHSLGLKPLAFNRLGIEMTPISDLIPPGCNQITMSEVPIEQVTPYASADVDMTWRLAGQILPELQAKGLDNLFWNLEMPLVPVLADMEMTGVVVDPDFLAGMSVELGQRLEELAGEISPMWATVSISTRRNNFPMPCSAAWGYPRAGSRRPRVVSIPPLPVCLKVCVAGILSWIACWIPAVDQAPEHLCRCPAQADQSYHRSHSLLLRSDGGGNRPYFLQQPQFAEYPRPHRDRPANPQGFRGAAGALPAGRGLLSVELRILAHVSGDKAMLANFAQGLDIHAATASQVYEVPIDQVTSEQRAVAKMMNFATSYGVSAYGLSSRTTLSMDEARRFMRTYFKTYPGVRRYLDETIATAKKQGFVETLMGRRRYFPVLQTTARGAQQARAAAERAAVNHPIQGSAADILKIALVRLHWRLREGGFDARMNLQVHDEIVLQVPEAELDAVAPLVVETMEGAYTLQAPLRAVPEFGRDWYDLQAWPATQ